MNGRRGFFKNLFGGAAVAVVAAKAEPPAPLVAPVAPPCALVLKFGGWADFGHGGDYMPGQFTTPQIHRR